MRAWIAHQTVATELAVTTRAQLHACNSLVPGTRIRAHWVLCDKEVEVEVELRKVTPPEPHQAG